MLQRLSDKLAHVLVVLSLSVQGLNFASVPNRWETQISTQTSSYPCEDILYDFDGSSQGWRPTKYSSGWGAVHWIGNSDVPAGKDSVSLHFDLDLAHPSVEYVVDLSKDPPGCATGAPYGAMLWAPGSVLSAWVWAPEGTMGDRDFANGVHLFAIDDQDRRLYGTWQSFQENHWSEVTLRLDDKTPTCGDMDYRFNPFDIQYIGINIALNDTKTVPLESLVRVAGITIKKDELEMPNSDHLYSFDPASVPHQHPQWEIRSDGWDAAAFTERSLENADLSITVGFPPAKSGGDSGIGVVSLIYAPPVDLFLFREGQNSFSVDVRFETSMRHKTKCPFGLTLMVFDAGTKSWYSSNYLNVGEAYWTQTSFPLSAFWSEKYPDRPLDLTQIEEIAIQITGKTAYQGKIWFDNIALGGKVPKMIVEPPKTTDFITTVGPHFYLKGERFRFIGANAEYLPFVDNATVEDVLERAKNLGISVVRTWGFSDGCEDKGLESCTERSRYFQPSPGVYNQAAFEHFDRIVLEAKERGIRLIVPLANNWDEYGGIPQYVCWQEDYNLTQDPKCSIKHITSQLHDKFYTDDRIKDLYKAYVQTFVNHYNPLTGQTYNADPTIMAWELINEPRAASDPSGERLHDWIVEMSNFLAQEAPLQLIGTGEEGWYIMSQQGADQSIVWQSFPANYWHYGVNWIPEACTESWGSNGVDFRSDHSSEPRQVAWQITVEDKKVSLPTRDERAAVPAVDYTTMHLYPAPGETSLANAPYCLYMGLDSLCTSFDNPLLGGEHQAREWIAQHVKTSHEVLKKPFILEEFNFPVLQRSMSSADEFQVTPEQRARLFTQYLDIASDLDVDGVMFWNLGYDGFADQPWSEAPRLRTWKVDPSSDSVDVVSNDIVSTATPSSIELIYDPGLGYGKATMVLSKPDVDWLKADGSGVYVNLFNLGDAQDVVFRAVFADGLQRPSRKIRLVSGTNLLELDKLFRSRPSIRSPYDCVMPEKEAPPLAQLFVTLSGYTEKGSVSFEFHSYFNDKYVIYPGEPEETVIDLASKHWEVNPTPKQPVVHINQGVTCGKLIHPELLDGALRIEFNLSDGLLHPDGVFYRYAVYGPDPDSKTTFGKLTQPGPGIISISLASIVKPGGYQVVIAPEGESFDSRFADACTFTVEAEPPK